MKNNPRWQGLWLLCCKYNVKGCSVAQLCPTLWDPLDWSTPGFPVLHYLLEFAQTHIHWVNDAIQLSHPLSPLFSSCSQSFQHQGLSQWAATVLELQLYCQYFQWIFSWLPSGLTGLISFQSKGFSRVSASNTVRKHQFFGAQPSLQSTSHIRAWLLEKP